MEYKEIYNMLQDIAHTNKIKNSLEDLYLYLHEIENMVQNNKENTAAADNHNEFRYKLQIMEQQIIEIDEFLQKENDNDINYDKYLP